MKARNVTTQDIRDIVTELNRDKYDDNVVIERIAQDTATTVSFKLGVAESRGKGSTRSRGGRHGRYACTHVFEDVMREVVARGGLVPIPKGQPGNTTGTTVKLETRRDVTNWAEGYNATNVGSMVAPAYPEDLCNMC